MFYLLLSTGSSACLLSEVRDKPCDWHCYIVVLPIYDIIFHFSLKWRTLVKIYINIIIDATSVWFSICSSMYAQAVVCMLRLPFLDNVGDTLLPTPNMSSKPTPSLHDSVLSNFNLLADVIFFL